MASRGVKFRVCARHGINLYFIGFIGCTHRFTVPSGVTKPLCFNWIVTCFHLAGPFNVRCLYFTTALLVTNQADSAESTTKERCLFRCIRHGRNRRFSGIPLHLRSTIRSIAVCGSIWGFCDWCINLVFISPWHGVTAHSDYRIR